MNNNNAIVINWIKSGMDYDNGIVLLIKLTDKQNYGSMFTGKERTMADKLSYEICKAAKVADHVTWKQFIQNAISAKEFKIPSILEALLDDGAPSPSVKSDEPRSEFNPSGEYPPIIHRIMHESASLFQQRSKLHKLMVDLPESNSLAVVQQRFELFNQIKSISERFNFLYETKQAFLNTSILPVEEDIHPEEKSDDKGSVNDLPDPVALKKQKKNLQSSNSKDQSKLDLLLKKQATDKKPIQSSLRWLVLESRIKKRFKLIEEIDYQLFNLSAPKC